MRRIKMMPRGRTGISTVLVVAFLCMSYWLLCSLRPSPGYKLGSLEQELSGVALVSHEVELVYRWLSAVPGSLRSKVNRKRLGKPVSPLTREEAAWLAELVSRTGRAWNKFVWATSGRRIVLVGDLVDMNPQRGYLAVSSGLLREDLGEESLELERRLGAMFLGCVEEYPAEGDSDVGMLFGRGMADLYVQACRDADMVPELSSVGPMEQFVKVAMAWHLREIEPACRAEIQWVIDRLQDEYMEVGVFRFEPTRLERVRCWGCEDGVAVVSSISAALKPMLETLRELKTRLR